MHTAKPHPFLGRRGPATNHWKGGRVRNGRYIYIKKPGHPRANTWEYVPEHVAVAEVALGRHLIVGEIVHHLDGEELNNSNSNLLICTQSYHMELHRRQRAYHATGNPNARHCYLCGNWESDPGTGTIKSSSFRHRACHARDMRKRNR